MSRRFLGVIAVVVLLAIAHESLAERSLADYRYFRALSVDLVGRPPTRDELAELAKPGFSFDHWIDARLREAGYVDRIRRVYADLLRLGLPENAAVFRPPSAILQWTTIQDGEGRTIDLYFRAGQRRKNPLIDGHVCFTSDESGLIVSPEGGGDGTPKRISKKLLDERTVLVHPWWLYSDYAAPKPTHRIDDAWARSRGYDVQLSMFVEPDRVTPMTSVRVCREEAQNAVTGKVFVTGRVVRKGDPLLPGRSTRLPTDTEFAKANAGRLVSCLDPAGFESSDQCGCGIGLERCMPAYPGGFVMPWQTPLGPSIPFDSAPKPAPIWMRAWWSEEANQFLEWIFRDDRDVREILTSPGTVVNGPLAQFYRYFANGTCCGSASELGYTKPVALFDPAKAPAVAPFDVAAWSVVPDRGPHASGVMTMPIFLLKYGSRRQRAHIIYSTFLCKEFIAETAKLEPSTEIDLTKRTGCATCHAWLEPMSAYFARIQESDWTYLPREQLPVSLPRCTAAGPAGMPTGACRIIYDPDFTDRSRTVLRGAYAAPKNADEGPRGFAKEIVSDPAFAPCVVRNVAQSLLGRQLTSEDEGWKDELADDFVASGYRMRPLVRAIVTSSAYREVNDRKPEAR